MITLPNPCWFIADEDRVVTHCRSRPSVLQLWDDERWERRTEPPPVLLAATCCTLLTCRCGQHALQGQTGPVHFTDPHQAFDTATDLGLQFTGNRLCCNDLHPRESCPHLRWCPQGKQGSITGYVCQQCGQLEVCTDLPAGLPEEVSSSGELPDGPADPVVFARFGPSR